MRFFILFVPQEDQKSIREALRDIDGFVLEGQTKEISFQRRWHLFMLTIKSEKVDSVKQLLKQKLEPHQELRAESADLTPGDLGGFPFTQPPVNIKHRSAFLIELPLQSFMLFNND